ncbi:MAG: C25 family cysteine peptidase [Bacteroidota bacterium]|nr:C25 family cysteine peptidase [Bacteroidota bacterium]
MKKLYFISVLILCAVVLATAQWKSFNGPEGKPVSVTLREDTPSGTVIEFTTPGYYLSSVDIQGKAHTVLSVPKAVTFLEKGYPELPRISRSIMIPDEAKMKFEIVEAEYETTYVATIAPSKGSLPRSIDPKTVPYTFSDVYKTDTWWPKEVIELSDPFILRDIRGITVRFNLFRHNVVRGQLIVCKQLVVRVFADGLDTINVKTNRKGIINLDFIEIYKNFFLNFSENNTVNYPSISDTGRMLILAADDFYNSMIPFRDWRTRKGHKTTLVKCSDVGTTWQSVKAYIQLMYYRPESRFTYILLVGDGTNIPSRGVPYPGYPDDPQNPKDPTYALLAGGDYYPDAYVSRFSAETVEQVDNQVMRTIKYETEPVSGDWFQKACGIASREGYPADSTRCNWLRDKLLGYGYTSVDKLYDITSAQPITNSINAGRGVVNFIGHGTPTEWGFNKPLVWPLFSVTDVQNLTNTNLLPFIFSVACQVGSFSEEATCFAEAWLRSGTKDSPKGAIGFFGSSIDQDWVEPTTAQAEAVDLLVADAKITVGGLCFNGVCKMLEQHGSAGVNEAETWHIFGDAATHVWTKTPMNFTSVSVTDNGSSITVNAGVAGSTICASSGNNGGTFWDRQDNKSSYTWNTSVRPLYITVMKHNYIPYTAVTGGTFASNETWFGNLNVLGNVTIKSGVTVSVPANAYLFIDNGRKIYIESGGKLIVDPSARLICYDNDAVVLSKEITTLNSTVVANWNMVSIPQVVSDFFKPAVYPSAISNAFAYEGSYVIKDILANGIGYWVKFGSDPPSVNYTGNSTFVTTVKLNPGWNLIGAISNTINTLTVATEPTNIITTPFFGYNGGYVEVSTIQAGKSYWVKVNKSGQLVLSSLSTSSKQPEDCSPPPPSPAEEPAAPILSYPSNGTIGISTSPTLYWNSSSGATSYRLQVSTSSNFATTVFNQGGITTTYKSVGTFSYSTTYYWRVNATNNNGTSAWCCAWSFTTQSSPGGGGDPCPSYSSVTAMDEFIISDANGNSQSMYARNGGRGRALGRMDDEMPPEPLGGVFNARFRSGKFIENLPPGKGLMRIPIKVKDAVYPLTFGWNIKSNNGISYWIDMPGNGQNRIPLTGSGNINYSDKGDVIVMAQAIDPCLPQHTKAGFQPIQEETQQVPESFFLSQNHPNPFNPTTEIHYGLPEDAHVVLKVYDILGREVMTLVDEFKEAGYYSIEFNGSSAKGGLSSGVYFYKIVSGNYTAVKKLVITK